MKMKKLLILLCAALGCGFVPSLRGQTTLGTNEAMGALRVERDPVLLSLGGAGSALTSTSQAWAAFGNPAAAVFAPKKVEAALSYASWSPQYAAAKNIAAGVTGHVKETVALSLGFARQGYPGLDDDPSSAFKPSDLLIRAGVGFSLSESLSLGLNAGLVKEALLSDYALSAFSVSAMAQYCAGGVNVAAGLSNLGGKVGESPLPTSAKLAAAYGLRFGESGVDFALDTDYYFSGNYSVAAGVNGSIGGVGFLRAGYRYASPNAVVPSYLGLGAGVSIAGFTLDLSYLAASTSLGGSWMAGLGYRF